MITDVDRIEQLLAEHVGRKTPFDRECVARCLGTAEVNAFYHGAGGCGGEIDPLHCAAYLLRGLATAHCFKDGNKRVAWLAALEVLEVRAAVKLEADQEDAARVVEGVATSKISVEQLIEWMAPKIVARN